MKIFSKPKLFFRTLSPLLLVLLLVSLPHHISRGCGPLPYSFLKSYTFVSPRLLLDRTEGITPFFLSFSSIYRQFYHDQQELKLEANVAEWRERICKQAREEDIIELIYRTPLSLLQRLYSAVGEKKQGLPLPLRNNTFADYLNHYGCVEIAGYLEFARRCEPHVTRSSPDAWQAPPRDTEAMQRLIEEGRRHFLRAESHYVRLRYAYQLIRLAHYSGAYAQVEELWEFLLPKVDRRKPSLIYYWTLSHLAGAQLRLGKEVDAAYHFMQVFLHCPSMRLTAAQSFRIDSDEQWQAVYNRCWDNAERAALFAMRATQRNSKAVVDMEQIYRLQPQSEFLEVLLVREIRKLERELLGVQFDAERKNSRQFFTIPREEAGSYTIDLQRFTRTVNKNGTAHRPELWLIAEGYLEFLAANYYDAARTFRQARRQVDNPLLEEQLQVFELALTIASWTEVTEEVEIEAYRLINSEPLYEKYPYFDAFLRQKLAFLYDKAGQSGKAFLVEHSWKELRYNPPVYILNDLIALSESVDLNRFERQLLEDEDGNSIQYALIDIKGTHLFGQDQLEAANEVYKKIPRAEREQFGKFYPFRERMRECIHCPIPMLDTLAYNRPDLISRLLNLEYDARADRNKGIEYFYLLGLAFYNMSYYGYSWNARDYFRSGANWGYRNDENVYPSYNSSFGNKEYKNLGRAINYFETVRVMASTDTSRLEMAARATFLAARCRQKMYFNSPEYENPGYNIIPNLPEKYMDYYQLLLKDYKDTEFVEGALQECKYLRAYAGR